MVNQSNPVGEELKGDLCCCVNLAVTENPVPLFANKNWEIIAINMLMSYWLDPTKHFH